MKTICKCKSHDDDIINKNGKIMKTVFVIALLKDHCSSNSKIVYSISNVHTIIIILI